MDDALEILTVNGQVRSEKVEDLLVEVSTGKHLFERSDGTYELLSSRMPTQQEQDNARVVYTRALHECRRVYKLMTRAEMTDYCLDTHDLDPAEAEEKKTLITLAEKLSKNREKTTDARQKVEIDAQMMTYRDRLIEIEMGEEQILQYSAENQAEMFRTAYLVAACTAGGEMLDEPVWKSWAEFKECSDQVLVKDSRKAFMRVSQGLPIKIIRALARTAEWRSRWKSVKESGNPLFDGSAIAWDKNKLNLIYWSDFYDSIYQHPDCPQEMIVNNDELLQDWLSQQVAKRNGNQAPGNRGTFTRQGKPMQKVGESHQTVNTPYKIRM